ncbi:hypothetical protein HDU77_011563, partial [Chytriomyces hyalinus]
MQKQIVKVPANSKHVARKFQQLSKLEGTEKTSNLQITQAKLASVPTFLPLKKSVDTPGFLIADFINAVDIPTRTFQFPLTKHWAKTDGTGSYQSFCLSLITTPKICLDEVFQSNQTSSGTLIDSSMAEDTLTSVAEAHVAAAPAASTPAAEVGNASSPLPGTKTGSLPATLITLKEGYRKAVAVCHLVGSKLNVFGKTACSVDSFYPGEVATQSPICLRDLTEEVTVAWNTVMALCNSLDSTAISRLSDNKAAIFEHVEPAVLNDIDHCIRFLMGQSDKQFKSALLWFRVPPPPAELQRLTAQGFEMYSTEATKKGQVLPPNLIATYLKRLLRKVNAGVITPSMQAAIVKMKPSEASAATIVQLLKLNGGRHHIVQAMARLASRILQVDAALSTELAVVMPLTNVGVSDAYAQLMAAKAMQVQACGDAERDARDAVVMKEMTEGLMKWNEILG